MAPVRTLLGCVFVAVCLTFGSGAAARDVTDAEKGQLAEKVALLLTALRDDRNAQIIHSIPPRVLSELAADAKLPVDDFVDRMADGMVGDPGLEKDSIVLDVDRATYLKAGNAVPYVLIPFRKVFKRDGQRREIHSHMVALMDGTDWYFVDLESPILPQMVRRLYPSFADVQLPRPEFRPLD